MRKKKHGGVRAGSGRPKIRQDLKLRTAAYSLKPETIDWIKEAADVADVSRSAYVQALLDDHRETQATVEVIRRAIQRDQESGAQRAAAEVRAMSATDRQKLLRMAKSTLEPKRS